MMSNNSNKADEMPLQEMKIGDMNNRSKPTLPRHESFKQPQLSKISSDMSMSSIGQPMPLRKLNRKVKSFMQP